MRWRRERRQGSGEQTWGPSEGKERRGKEIGQRWMEVPMRCSRSSREPRVPGLALFQPCLPQCSPSVKWGWGPTLHFSPPLCWSGGEATGKERRPEDGAALTPGTCPGPSTRGTPSFHNPSRALAPQHTPDGPPTAKAGLRVPSCLQCPPSHHLVPS